MVIFLISATLAGDAYWKGATPLRRALTKVLRLLEEMCKLSLLNHDISNVA